MMRVISGSGRTLSTGAAKTLEWMMDHPGMMITDHMAVECGVCESTEMFRRHFGQIRAALSSDQSLRLQSLGQGRYCWDGELVEMIHSEISGDSTERDQSLRIRSCAEVAEILGLPLSQVREIENRAFRKLRRNPKMRQAWNEVIASHKPVRYDPFHEIWLYSVAEDLANKSAYPVDRE